jgi:hypothetical protein
VHAGRRRKGIEVTERAVAQYRELAGASPAFLTELAATLTNLSGFHNDLGRRGEGLANGKEAVSLYRRLAVSEPDAHTEARGSRPARASRIRH